MPPLLEVPVISIPTMWSVFKFLFLLCCPLLLAGYTSAFIGLVSKSTNRLIFTPYAEGFAAGIAIWWLFWQRLMFFSTLVHELNHLLAAAIFLRRPVALTVHETGEGEAQMGGNLLNPFISLAPYCVPLAAIASIPLYLLLKATYLRVALGLLGFLLATHWVDVSKTFRSYQPDIQESGMFFSLAFCLLMNVIMSAIVTTLAMNAPSEVVTFLHDGYLLCKQMGYEEGCFAVHFAETGRTAASSLLQSF